MTTYRKLHGKAVKTVTTNPTDDAAEGQIWFNSTDNKFRSVVNLEAWSSGSPMINESRQRYATGTQTAGLLFGGYKNPNTNIGSTEEYNGSGYSAGGTMSTARRSPGGAGVQTSSLAIGGYTSTAVTTVEEYNGSSWTSSPALNNAKFIAGSFGTSSACVTEGGAPAPKAFETRDYTYWTAGPGPIGPANSYGAGAAGTSTAGLFAGGYPASPTDNLTRAVEWDGSSFSSTGSTNTARGYMGGFGVQTAAVMCAGKTGPGPNSTATETYDGSSFTTSPATLGTALAYGGACGTSSAGLAAGFSEHPPSYPSLSEEYNSSATVITAAAWSSSGNVPVSIRGGGSGGTKTSAWMSGGLKNSPTTDRNDTYLYDGTSWTAGNDLPNNYFIGGGTGPATAGLLWDGIVSGGGPGTTTYEFDGTNWTAASTYPAIGPNGSQGSTGAGVGQTAAVSMGGTGDPPPAQSARMIAYDGSSWTADTSMPTGVSGCAADGPNSAIWIAGGYSSPDSTSTASKEYDGSSWTTTGNLAFALAPSGQRFQGWGPQTSAIIAGGTGSSSTNHNCQQYNGTIWATAVSLGTGRDSNSFCSKTAGTKEGFIAAGYGDSANTNATEEFTEETTSLNVKDLTQSS